MEKVINLALESLARNIFKEQCAKYTNCTSCNGPFVEHQVQLGFTPKFLAVTLGFFSDEDGIKSDRKIVDLNMKLQGQEYSLIAIVEYIYTVLQELVVLPERLRYCLYFKKIKYYRLFIHQVIVIQDIF